MLAVAVAVARGLVSGVGGCRVGVGVEGFELGGEPGAVEGGGLEGEEVESGGRVMGSEKRGREETRGCRVRGGAEIEAA